MTRTGMLGALLVFGVLPSLSAQDQKSEGKTPPELRLVVLQKANAQDLASTLGSLLQEDVIKVVADLRRNSLLIAGERRNIRLVARMAQLLDTADDAGPSRPKAPQAGKDR